MPDIEAIRAFLPLFIRSLGAVMFIPLSTESSSYFRNISVAILLAALLSTELPLEHDYSYLSLVGEFLIGIMLGLPAILIIEGASMLGELVDNGRGQNFSSMYDPLSGSHSSSLALLSHRFVTALLLVSGYFEILISSLYSSIKQIPLASISHDKLAHFGERIIPLISQALSSAFACYLIFATIYIVVDLLIALISKVLNNSALSGESFQLKSYLAFMMILILLNLINGTTMLSLAMPRADFLSGF